MQVNDYSQRPKTTSVTVDSAGRNASVQSVRASALEAAKARGFNPPCPNPPCRGKGVWR